jgi:hypothetical protein
MVALDSGTPQPFRGTTRKRQWQRLSRGLYIPRTRARCLTETLRGWELVLPKSAAFTSLTAAELYGWWLPQAVPHPVFAAVPSVIAILSERVYSCTGVPNRSRT